jgi:hypothetical protein
VSGRVTIVGLGPGAVEWMTPEASAAIRLRAILSATVRMCSGSHCGRANASTQATIGLKWSAPGLR